ncbi:MAG: hypothetical protein EXR11_02805 [Rhodospirillaceae bacterium]|nr:hypothetical protein [Rhodospirillaceae bacterium]
MAKAAITWEGFLWRWILALVVVLGTFNPTDYSYYSWVTGAEGMLPLKALVGVVLLIVIIIYLRATWFSIGPIGLVLAAAFFGALIWVLVDFGLLVLGQGSIFTWIILVVLSLILAIGMSFSLFRRRISGQVDVDDVET